MPPNGRMRTSSQNSGRTAFPSPRLSGPLRPEKIPKEKRSRDEYWEIANYKGGAAVWVDSICLDDGNPAERRQASTLMRRIYRSATRAITWIGPGIENGPRRMKVGRRTKKVLAIVFACVCATQLLQNPSGVSGSKTRGPDLSRGRVTSHPSDLSRWAAKVQEQVLLRSGDQKTLHDIMKHLTSLLEAIHMPSFLSEPHPLLLLFTSIVFAFPITYLRHTNRRDKYQDEIIVGVMLLTVAVVCSMTVDHWDTTMMTLPWSIILGLLLSSLIHRIFGLRRGGLDSSDGHAERRQELNTWLDEKGKDDTSRDTA